MSLSEQTARVAGGGKNTLKAILQKLGVTVGDVPIDQYAALAAQISDKLLPDNLLDGEVSGLYELPSSAVVKDVLKKIGEFIPTLSGHAKIEVGTYAGTGEEQKTINLNANPDFFIVQCLNPKSEGRGLIAFGVRGCKGTFGMDQMGMTYKVPVFGWREKAVVVNVDNDYSSGYNESGKNYKYISMYMG